MKTKKHHTEPPPLSIDPHKLVFDADKKREFLIWLKGREDKLQTMLLWRSIAVLVSYSAVMAGVVKLYASLNAGHPVYMVVLIVIILCMFAVFVWLQYTINAYKPSHTNLVFKELLHFKVYIARRQISLLAGYIVIYSVFVLAACALCYDAVYNARQILRVTAPVSILVYVTGLFLLLKLAYKRRTYLTYINAIDDSIVAGFSER